MPDSSFAAKTSLTTMLSRTSKASSEIQESTGLKDEITSFAKSAGNYASARAELLAIEGHEAADAIKKKMACLVIAGLALLFGYPILLVTGIHFLGQFFRQQFTGPLAGWTGAALLIGCLHLIVGIFFLTKSRKCPGTPLFELTRSEWKKDQQWLSKKTTSGN
ncbi:phage holin family protein [Akkermansiaceae bacterium]|nr:phage holin family protein [Akkermansiaceae bacterium]MDB4363703.1 phage holin family protein [Akkermansiaceae bacterium]MDB4813502.1 phage holin family protein [bacterium]MDC1404323.1 phage holin family protein [Akkermansiaceae bacterium]